MIILKRAWRYLVCNKLKSFMILLIVFCVALFQLVGVCMKEAVLQQKQYTSSTVEACAEISDNSNKSIESLSIDLAGVKDNPHVKNILFNGVSTIGTDKTVELSSEKNTICWYGCENIQKYDDFNNGDVKLDSGEFPTSKNKGVLVSNQLFENNGFALNDYVTINQNGENLKTQIVGTYEIENEDINYYNFYSDSVTFDEVFLDDRSTSAIVYLDSIENLESTIAQLQEELGIDNYVVGSKTSYDDIMVLSAISAVSDTADMMIYLGNGFGFIILLIVSILWTKGSLRRIAVYLSLGERKIRIVLQLMCEIIILAIAAVCLAYLAGIVVCPEVVSNIASGSLQSTDFALSDIFGSGTAFSLMAVDTLIMYGLMSFGTLLIAMLAVCVYILTCSPKKIMRIV